MNRDQFKNRMESIEGHFVRPEDLRVGLYVHLDLGWMDHPFTFSNFMIKDEDQIKKIRALKLDKIRYDPMRSTVVPDFPKTIETNWLKAEPAQPVAQAAPGLLISANSIKLEDSLIAWQAPANRESGLIRVEARSPNSITLSHSQISNTGLGNCPTCASIQLTGAAPR